MRQGTWRERHDKALTRALEHEIGRRCDWPVPRLAEAERQGLNRGPVREIASYDPGYIPDQMADGAGKAPTAR